MVRVKAKNIAIKMVSQANTGYFYTTTKNPTNSVNKLMLKKYDPIVRRHVLFQESKMPTSKGGRKV